ncbi:DNRLRE domain-containing protein [Streptomyces bambusae]|uniref:DNRLRE domain-containing protein n=1 Tax=Streptomyces bambusae TaxID=1550616 RepID=A0ABS6Z9H0_9ACTN|nr:DNRLRE domain-containing protein [Streptomyces bambusae]MBW5484410.1 DNRLRE domain-containing protein [Streptomyces bambusae]
MPLGIHLTGRGDTTARPDKAHDNGPVTAAQAIRQARETGKEVAVTADWRDNTTVWAQPNGRLKARVHASAVRAKVGDEWKPIDTGLQRVGEGFSPKAVNSPLVFSGGSRPAAGAGSSGSPGSPGSSWTELVRLKADGHDMTLSWPGPLPAPVVDGPRALYENIRPGIDLVLTALDGGYSHLLVVKDKKAAADPLLGELNYRLSSPTLSFRVDEESSTLSARNAAGEEVAGSPTTLMWDSAGKVTTPSGGPAVTPGPAAKDHPTLALPGIAGSQGAHTAVAKASLSADNALTLKPDSRLLNDESTVYPVFIDPSLKMHTNTWALLYRNFGNTSFFNGENYNTPGTNEARIGHETDTYGTSRSIFNFDFDSAFHGAGIYQATLHAFETHSWSCEPSPFSVYATPFVTSSSTWNNTDNASYWGWDKRVAGANVAHGNATYGCPDDWVGMDVKSIVETGAASRWQALTLGFRADREGDTNSWKKFLVNGETDPYIEIHYNKRPDTPVAANMSTTPGGACLTTSPGTVIGKTDVTFEAKTSDGDGNLKQINFRMWTADGTPVPDEIGNVIQNTYTDGKAWHTVRWEALVPGKTYYWLAQAIDTDGFWSGSGPMDSGGGGWCTFTVDHTAPANPAVRSGYFPPPGPDGAEWSSAPAGTPDQWIEVLGNGTKPEDIREYQWSLNQASFDQKVWPWNADLASIKLQVDAAGPNVLYVRTVSKAGNVSVPTTYLFYVRPRTGLDRPGDVTGDGSPDILAVDDKGNLRTYAGDPKAPYRGDIEAWMPAATDNGKPVPDGYWKDAATGKTAIIGHSTDWFPGDGLTDLIARMPDGKLYVYPGDGFGRFDIGRRTELLLPAGSPDPAGFTQIVPTEDVTGDGMADFFALADNGDTFWAFTGYTGASFTSVKQIGGAGWSKRDIIGVRDANKDNVPDLIFRDESTSPQRLVLRKGKPGANGGVDLVSIGSAAASLDGDRLYGAGGPYGGAGEYGTPGWDRATWPLVRGTTDLNDDGYPDFYLTRKDGTLHLFYGGSTAQNPWRVDEEGWNTFLSIG